MMYRKILQLKTHEASLVFQINMKNKKSLYRATQEHLAYLYKAAKAQNKDAIHYLNTINQSIDKFLREAKEKIALYRRRVEDMSPKTQDENARPVFKEACYSTHKLGVRLMACIEHVDEILSLLFILLKINPLMYRPVYYGLKKSFYLPFLQLFSRICAININNEIATVTLAENVNNILLEKKRIENNPIKKAENSCL